MVIEAFHVLKCKFLSFLHNNIYIEEWKLSTYVHMDRMINLTT